MSRTTSIALAAGIVMSALAGMSYDMTKWRALEWNDPPATDLRVGKKPSMAALLARKKTAAWLVLVVKNGPAWVDLADKIMSRNHDSGKRICATLDNGHAYCAASFNALDDKSRITIAELALYESKGEGDLGKELGPFQRIVCVNNRPFEEGWRNSPGECRDFDTGEELDVLPPLATL